MMYLCKKEMLVILLSAISVQFFHSFAFGVQLCTLNTDYSFSPLAATVSPSLPLLVLGVIGIFGGVLALFLPETMDKELPQTMEDGENFGKEQKFFNLPCCERRKEEHASTDQLKRVGSTRSSIRASVRGEQFRSNIINRSLRIKHSQSKQLETA